ncbi:MAG: BON domain-containing protein [Proteobacteria bacterium]|nr:BON domain-containing protein [Pseudomonadota bacterium]
MKTTMNRTHKLLAASAALAAAFVLGGCDQRRSDEAADAGRHAVAQAEQKAHELQNDAAKGLDKAREASHEMAQNAKQAGDRMGDKVADAVITSSINAELAKDSSLSATKIDVDTTDGRVVLHGTAPSEDARDRATTLASNVKGVVSVDNQLTVQRQG